MPRDRTIGDIGELELIERIVAKLPASGDLLTGDDAAVVSWGSDRIVLTVDAIVEGVDFEFSYATGHDVGWKALAVSLSDIAAMGGIPRNALTALCAPPTEALDVVEGISQGLSACAERFGVALAGGDVSSAKEVVVSVTALGTLSGEPALRSGARRGDLIFVTGTLGAAAAGLELLRSGKREPDQLVGRQLQPQPRVAEGPAIRDAGATAMIDISDGLAVDLWHLMQASGTGCDVNPDLLPVDPGVVEVGLDAIGLALLGGEDYELLFTAPPAAEGTIRERMIASSTPVTVIGVVNGGDATVGGRSLDELRRSGWEHLRTR